jgi:hypothetical protein
LIDIMNLSLQISSCGLAAILCATARAQDTRSLADLQAQLDALTLDFENLLLQDVMPALGDSVHGLGPAASKVYNSRSGLSIGGYGEVRYRNFDSPRNDEFDFHRNVLYFGHKFNDKWILNTEIELEHATGSFLEFAYLDHLHSDALNLRAGLMLIPMGLVNEMHEPTTFLGSTRSLTESYVIPSTWRENGLGLFGSRGALVYKLYFINGMDGGGYGGPTGLRGGRQKGAKAAAEDLAVVGSLNWTPTPGLALGLSAYEGAAGQNAGKGDMDTSIFELHADYRSGPFWGRALVADASVRDRIDGDMSLGGGYLEVGYDVLAESETQSLYPFLRWEAIDTDVSVGGFKDDVLTLGLHYNPIDQVVFKLDHAIFQDGTQDDVTTFLIGYVF